MESDEKNRATVSGINDPIHSKTKKHSKKKSKKRKHTSRGSGSEDDKSKKLKSKHKKCKKRHKQSKDKKHKHSKSKTKSPSKVNSKEDESMIGPEIPSDLRQTAQSIAPISKEEWDKRHNTIRRVFDEETGRSRLIRGEGEIIEEIVSRDRHKRINRQATQGDGEFFQSKLKKYV